MIVNDVTNICTEVPDKDNYSIYNAYIDFRIPISLTVMFSYFNTRSLTRYEIEKYHEYDVIYLSLDTASCNPTNSEWANQEMECIDHQG